MKDLFILRGVPGCGKSTVAELLARDTGIVCTADEWFYKKYGEYKWSPEEAGIAHKWCQELADSAMHLGHSPVIIANTNTATREFKTYVEMAEKRGYKVHFLVVENRHGGVDSHNVPEEALNKMEERIKSNLKLR